MNYLVCLNQTINIKDINPNKKKLIKLTLIIPPTNKIGIISLVNKNNKEFYILNKVLKNEFSNIINLNLSSDIKSIKSQINEKFIIIYNFHDHEKIFKTKILKRKEKKKLLDLLSIFFAPELYDKKILL